MGKLIHEGIKFDIVKYTDYTIQQKNGVRITTFNTYEKAKSFLDKID